MPRTSAVVQGAGISGEVPGEPVLPGASGMEADYEVVSLEALVGVSERSHVRSELCTGVVVEDIHEGPAGKGEVDRCVGVVAVAEEAEPILVRGSREGRVEGTSRRDWVA